MENTKIEGNNHSTSICLSSWLAFVDPEGADVWLVLDGEDVVHGAAAVKVLADLNTNID